MDSDKLAKWINLDANFALLARLGLVAYQLNQNSRLARAGLLHEGNVPLLFFANYCKYEILVFGKPSNNSVLKILVSRSVQPCHLVEWYRLADSVHQLRDSDWLRGQSSAG